MSDFRIKTYVLGGVSTNCYLVFREGEKTAVIIDPADNADYLKNKCREFGVKPEAVLLTHAHFDHMLAADDIRKAYGCKVYVHMDDERMLNDPFLNLSGTMGTEQTGISADHLLRDGDVLHFLNREWKVMATPGHTAGSVCYYLPEEKVLFSGDTLFADLLDLGGIFLIRIFKMAECLYLIYIVSRIDTYFLNILCCYICYLWVEVNVGNQWNHISIPA